MPPSHPIDAYYRSAVAKLYLRRRCLKPAAFVCSIVLIALFLILKLGFDGVYRKIIQEDGPLENAQAAAFFAASVISFSVTATFARRRQTSYALESLALTVALILIFLEEVSWGQRALGLATPEFFKAHNTQDELTLHNLDWVNHLLPEAYIFFGLLCSFGWLFVPRRTEAGGGAEAAYLVPSWYLMFYFLPVAVVNSYFEFNGVARLLGVRPEHLRIGYFVVWRDQEPAELLLALGLLLLVVRNRLRQDAGVTGLADGNLHTQV